MSFRLLLSYFKTILSSQNCSDKQKTSFDVDKLKICFKILQIEIQIQIFLVGLPKINILKLNFSRRVQWLSGPHLPWKHPSWYPWKFLSRPRRTFPRADFPTPASPRRTIVKSADITVNANNNVMINTDVCAFILKLLLFGRNSKLLTFEKMTWSNWNSWENEICFVRRRWDILPQIGDDVDHFWELFWPLLGTFFIQPSSPSSQALLLFRASGCGGLPSLLSGSVPAIIWTLCCRPRQGISYRCVC